MECLMPNAKYLCLLILWICGFAYTSANTTNAIKDLHAHAQYIKDLYSNCKIENVLSEPVPCGRLYKTTFDKIVNAPIREWEESNVSVLLAFESMYHDYNWLEKKRGMLVDDDTLINLAIKLLADTTKNAANCASTGYRLLIDHTYYTALQKQSQFLSRVLEKTKLNNACRYNLMSVAGLMKNQKDIQIDSLGLFLRASAGIQNAKDSIIKLCSEATDYNLKRKLIVDLVRLNDKSSTKIVITKVLKSGPISTSTDGRCIDESLWYPVLMELKKWHPEAEILTKYDEYFPLASKNGHDSTVVKPYMQLVFDWLSTTYDISKTSFPPLPTKLKAKCFSTMVRQTRH